jgi:signal transduction histidine kinase
VIGRHVGLLLPAHMRDQHGAHVRRFQQAAGEPRSMGPRANLRGQRADGSEFPIDSSISRTVVDGKTQLTAVVRDITERQRAEAELQEMNRQLRALSASLQGVREQERSRIARELHDELGQQLTGLKLELSWLAGRLKDGREASADKVDAMRDLLDQSITSVRRISTELRPLMLDDLGLREAVTWQATELEKRSGMHITLDLGAADLVGDDDLATALFRIVQESLTNAVRHASASQAAVRLFEEDGELVLSISDNGCGIGDGMRKGGIGMVSMRERAMALGARFQIRSSPGAGTRVEVRLSLDSRVADAETLS